MLIVEAPNKDPSVGDLFTFRNRSGNKPKCVYFDGRCFWLLYCCLEEGRFKLPEPVTEFWEVSHSERQRLFSGINFMKQTVEKSDKIEYFYKKKNNDNYSL